MGEDKGDSGEDGERMCSYTLLRSPIDTAEDVQLLQLFGVPMYYQYNTPFLSVGLFLCQHDHRREPVYSLESQILPVSIKDRDEVRLSYLLASIYQNNSTKFARLAECDLCNRCCSPSTSYKGDYLGVLRLGSVPWI